jgi:tRNA-2-methylthio-N6-dimethylallyladenosine synthase
MPRVYLKTHGCQMNQYDSARMADVLREAGGYEQVDRPEDADLLLLNTCSIREKAQEKVFSQLGAWRALKTARPDVIIGVGGCVASQEGKASPSGRRSSTWCSDRRRCTACPRCSTSSGREVARSST